MNEKEFREKLDIWFANRKNDVQFVELKFKDGMTFADYHVTVIKNKNNGQWKDSVAKSQYESLKKFFDEDSLI